MGVSDRTRKILWAKAGGRCSICRCQVITEGTESDDPSVFGEEAHIVARSAGGPRAEDPLAGDINGYDNLILLCNKHHKQVDDQPNHFTSDRLHELKRKHEDWNASLDRPGPSPIKVVPDPSHPDPKLLKVITSGNALWSMVEASKAFQHSRPDHVPDEDEELIIDFLDSVREWGDISSELESLREKREAAKSLNEQIRGLADAGYVVGAKLRHMLMTGGVFDEPWPWPMLVVEVQPAAHARLQRLDDDDQRSENPAPGPEPSDSRQKRDDLVQRAEDEVRQLEREFHRLEMSARGGTFFERHAVSRQLDEAKRRLARIDPTSPLLM
ncbi:HNH endonuclease [Micromonospora chalcea]